MRQEAGVRSFPHHSPKCQINQSQKKKKEIACKLQKARDLEPSVEFAWPAQRAKLDMEPNLRRHR